MSKLEELSSSVDEVWMQLAELLEHVEAIEQQLRKRDAMNLLMVRHVERLVREKDQLARELADERAIAKSERGQLAGKIVVLPPGHVPFFTADGRPL